MNLWGLIMPISIRQIRAARGLLGWTQNDLARKAGLSLRALSSIESALTTPRSDTQSYLQQALEEGGVEFLEGQGVRLREEVLQIHQYEGAEALQVIFSDVFHVCQEGGEILGLNLDERYFQEHGGDRIESFYKEMKKRKIRERLLIRKGDTVTISDKSHYRWLRRDLFTEVPFIVYGNTILQVLWKPTLRVILIRNQSLANAYKKQFDIYWEKESEPVTD